MQKLGDTVCKEGTGASFRLVDSEGLLHELSTKLELFGLTYGQARVYLFLLGKAPVPAREISKGLGRNRIDVYRKLRQLEDLGLLEVDLDSPKRFTSLEPKKALSALVNRTLQKVSSLKSTSLELIANLEALQKSKGLQWLPPVRQENADVFYRLGRGRPRYAAEITELVRRAQKEVFAVTTRNGIIRAYLTGFYDEYKKATSRGVTIRMLAEVGNENLKYAEKFAKILQLHHTNGVHFRLIEADRSIAVL